MVPGRLSRRDVLDASGVALLGLAGCTAYTAAPDRGDRRTSSPTASEPTYSRRVDTPESSQVRNTEGNPAVRSSASSPGEDLYESSAGWEYEDWLVTAPRERDALAFAGATTGVDAARDFLVGTDLSEETLLVHQYNVPTCKTRHLERLEWRTDATCGAVECVELSLDYEEASRETDCRQTDADDGPPYSAGSYANETTFVRIPARVQSYGAFTVRV